MIEVIKGVQIGNTIYKPGQYNIDDPELIEKLEEAGALGVPMEIREEVDSSMILPNEAEPEEDEEEGDEENLTVLE